jgi:hypothetical protein
MQDPLAKINESFLICAVSTVAERILFSPRPLYPSDDERQRIARAREAAEALFAAKPAAAAPAPAPAGPAAEPAVRKPRVLSVVPPVPAHPEPPPPAAGRRARRPRPRNAVPRSQYARIRTWVEYGMTATEVAGVYGTAVGEIERILRKG